jgi:hypothetical protein
LLTNSTNASATRSDSSYFDFIAPNAPAIPQQPVSRSRTEVFGIRSANCRLRPASVNALA